MEIIEPYHVFDTPIDGIEILLRLERFGRVCYKSEGRIAAGSAEKFIHTIVKNGHESILEHVNVSVRFVCDRGVTHELVRHRLASYSQESTRYCNYGKTEITFIRPPFWKINDVNYVLWQNAMNSAEEAYLKLLANGTTPQEARTVLPNSLKTEIIMTTNLREWRHVLRVRCNIRAHPQMRQLMVPLLREFKGILPIVFNDIPEE